MEDDGFKSYGTSKSGGKLRLSDDHDDAGGESDVVLKGLATSQDVEDNETYEIRR